ncbi:hypothetical protein [Candidatus Erwinia dacicola]|uniref:Uncharacterized protein n=1 Tax=Candidatus Erwinia dacicola TaxID=252393 RepID=A0A328TKC9_9GAMM|nr:hypothetical protein [Candidatus Erwinia dacicola]RAP71077.1 hypothetical protein ACZ87_02115 [Candidatus Erwinia dacicola]
MADHSMTFSNTLAQLGGEDFLQWLLQNRYLPQHTMAEIDQTAEDDVIDALPLST